MTVASLPMYWRAENAALWRGFWSVAQDCAASQGLSLPDLTPPEQLPVDWYDHWLSPDLTLSMTCGLPFRTCLKGKVQYVGTLDFALGGPQGHYHSQIIRRPGLSGTPRKLAYNSADSQSGWAAAQDMPDLTTPIEQLPTGGHAASLAAVAEGRADIACIDAVTWRLLIQLDDKANNVEPCGTTQPTPGLPLITALGTDPAPIRAALVAATKAFAPKDPFLMGGPMTLCVLDEHRYFDQPIPASPAA